VSRVLVARLDSMGDVLLSGPAVRAVATGAERVTMLCGPAGRPAAELLPGVDDVLELDAPWVALEAPAVDPDALMAFAESVRIGGFDQAVVLTSFHQSPLPLALLLKLAGVTVIAAASEDHPGSLLDVRRRPELDVGRHEVERSLALVAMLGYALPAGDGGGLAVRRPLPRWRPFGRPYAVVHPGASVPSRAIGASRARRTVEWLTDRGWPVVVTGSTAERALAAAVGNGARRSTDVVDLTGRLDLPELAGVLDGAAVVISGNTGPAHLAAAVGTPVVSVFAPVVAANRWRPWRTPLDLLGDQSIDCAGCRARTCPYVGQPCLRDVTPERLGAAAQAWLQRAAVGRLTEPTGSVVS
jgi:ADP-heptose:LPS heptosyltransferase